MAIGSTSVANTSLFRPKTTYQSDEALAVSFLTVLDPHLLVRTQRERFPSL